MITPKTTSIWFSHELSSACTRTGCGDSLRQEHLAARHRFHTPLTPFLPSVVVISHALATTRTKVSEQMEFSYPLRTPTMLPGPSPSVCSMWLAESASVRVGPSVGAISSPVVTWKLPIRVNVPCRLYSNDWCRLPRDHQLGRAVRSTPECPSSRPRDGVGVWSASTPAPRGRCHRPPRPVF